MKAKKRLKKAESIIVNRMLSIAGHLEMMEARDMEYSTAYKMLKDRFATLNWCVDQMKGDYD